MGNYKFLEKYYRLQHTIMFDKLLDVGFAMIGFSSGDDSVFWNNALVNKKLAGSELKSIEETFGRLGRIPAIYFENRSDLSGLVNGLKESGYKKGFEDSWQFWGERKIEKKYFEFVRKVKTERELKVFLEVFEKCYQKNDPQNPYGELGDYLKVSENVWRKHNKSNRLEYFMVYKGKQPVAVSTLTNYQGIGYISNVGSLKEVRGGGYGKAATLCCVQKSMDNGNFEHCLATEEGEYPNEFYKRIGFAIRFRAMAYKKV